MAKLNVDGWSTQIASDVNRDSVSLELLGPSGAVVAEVSRYDGDKSVRVTTFGNEVPLGILLDYCGEALSRLDPFEDGTPLMPS